MLGENLVEKLSFENQDAIAKYIKAYADMDAQGIYKPEDEPMAPLDIILKPWSMAKSEYLYKLFGEQFILSKDILFELSQTELSSNCEAMMSGWGKTMDERRESPVCRFVEEFRNQLVFTDLLITEDGQSTWVTKTGFDSDLARHMSLLFCSQTLAKNLYNGETFEIPNPKTGKSFKIQHGCKAIKTIVKIAEMYDIPGVEEFRNAHSQVLNQKKVKGRLSISIHPLDYMTMSDNECDWDSCMSWWNSGAYRQGTVEMLNSSCVVVAYLESSKDMSIPGGHQWNSKKWRELYIVTPDIITNVKGYPYNNNELSISVVEWLKELADAHMNWDLSPKRYDFNGGYHITEDIRFDPCTNTMYNDFDNSDEHFAYLSKSAETWDNIHVNYSGVSECMWCGKTCIYIDTESQLLCDRCEAYYVCDICGERITQYEFENNTPNGWHVCDYCYGERFVTDAVSGELKFDDDCESLAVAYNGRIYVDLGLYIDSAEYSYEDVIDHIGSHEDAKIWRVEVKIETAWDPNDYWTRRYTVIKLEDIRRDAFNCGNNYDYDDFIACATDLDSLLNRYNATVETEKYPWSWVEII